jgi:thiol-disulfide isomerase/thioredoxin
MGQTIWQVTVLILVASAVVQGVVLVAVMRQVGGILLQITPPRPGALEEGPTIGSVLELPRAERGRASVVLFVAPNCTPCKDLLPSVPVVARHYRELEFVMVVTGKDEADRLSYGQALDGVSVRPDWHGLYEEWQIPGTPYAVGLDEDGVVRGAGVVNVLDHLEALAEAVLGPLNLPGPEAPSTTNGQVNGKTSVEASSNRMEGVDA